MNLRPRASVGPLLLAIVASLGPACSDEPTDEERYREGAEAAARDLDLTSLQTWLAALAADDMEGRDNLSAGGKKARDYLVAELTALGLKPAGKTGFTQTFDRGVNVLALLPGRDPALASEVILLSAHYDHLGLAGVSGSQCKTKSSDLVCNGASDNASGCAALLGLARAVSRSETGVRRSLLFAFWDAEEDGLLGSKYYADTDPVTPLAQVTAVLNADMLGTEIIPGVSSSFVLGCEYTTGLRERVTENARFLSSKVYAVSSYFVGDDAGGRSDHMPFRLKKLPSVFFGSGATPEYHTVDDELSVVKLPQFLSSTQHLLLVAADLANSESRPGYVADPKPHIDDAKAMVELGEALMKNPKALGLTDAEVSLLKMFVDKLKAYVETPPTTDAEWQSYQGLIKSLITLVYTFQ